MTQPAQRSWWSRNWIWVVPVGCLSPLAICGGGIALVFVWLFGAIKSSAAYTNAIARAQTNPAVQAALGVPITAASTVSGNFDLRNDNGVESGTANFSIPISGPKGSGTIQVVATNSRGQWTFSTLQVTINGQDSPIDLLSDDW
jgi:hypothetical protein